MVQLHSMGTVISGKKTQFFVSWGLAEKWTPVVDVYDKIEEDDEILYLQYGAHYIPVGMDALIIIDGKLFGLGEVVRCDCAKSRTVTYLNIKKRVKDDKEYQHFTVAELLKYLSNNKGREVS